VRLWKAALWVLSKYTPSLYKRVVDNQLVSLIQTLSPKVKAEQGCRKELFISL